MYILLGLMVALLLAVFLTMLMSFAVAWYEKSNAHPELIATRFRPGTLLGAAWLLLYETSVLYLTILAHPLGYLPQRRSGNHPGDQPIILLHGLFQNRICWWLVRLRMRQQGIHNVLSLNLPPWKDVEALTETLAKRVDQLRLEEGVERVTLIGHSMGGLIARNYLQIRGGAAKVERLITLGTPHLGSKLAPFAISRMGRDLLPGSEFLTRLAQAPLPESVKVFSIYSPQDNLVLPTDNARWEDAQNIEVQSIGHTSLLYRCSAFECLLNCLEDKNA